MLNRQCIANIWEYNSTENESLLVQRRAILREWGTEIDDDNHLNYTVAIVELLDNGQIITCIPSNIRLLDTCSLCGKTMTYIHNEEYKCTCGNNITKHIDTNLILERIKLHE